MAGVAPSKTVGVPTSTTQHLQGLLTRKTATAEPKSIAQYFNHVADAVHVNDELTALRKYNLKRRWQVAAQGYEAVLNRKKRSAIVVSRPSVTGPAYLTRATPVAPASVSSASSSTTTPSPAVTTNNTTDKSHPTQAAVAAAAAAVAAASARAKLAARPLAAAPPVAAAPAKPVHVQPAPLKPAPIQAMAPQPMKPQVSTAPAPLVPTPITSAAPAQLHAQPPVSVQKPQPKVVMPTPSQAPTPAPVSMPVPVSVPVQTSAAQLLQPQPVVAAQTLPRRSDFVVGTRVMIRHTADLVACGARNLVGKTGRIVAVPQIYGQEVYSVYIDEHETMFQVPFNALVLISPPAPTPMPINMQHQPPPRSMHQLAPGGMIAQAQASHVPVVTTNNVIPTAAVSTNAAAHAMRPTPSIEDIKLEHSYQLHRLMQQQYREIQVLQQQYAECRLVNPAALPSIQKELSKLRLVHLSQVQTLKSKQALDLLGK